VSRPPSSPTREGIPFPAESARAWLVLAAGLLALTAPTVYSLAITIWPKDEQAHGPLIVAVSAWLAWCRRHRLRHMTLEPGGHAAWALLGLSLLIYTAGRSQGMFALETPGLILSLVSGAAVVGGWSAVRVFAFPLAFLVFAIPLPNIIIDALTGSLKQLVSDVAESLLHAGGLPVARSGVVLMVGQYQLLVADACSGLNSMFSLAALGALYIHIAKNTSRLHTILLVLSILPIAFCANIVRVMVLVLVTYYFGDEAGQGFVHGAAGMILFLVAIVLLMALDASLRPLFKSRASRAPLVPK
jgi:exosortase B